MVSARRIGSVNVEFTYGFKNGFQLLVVGNERFLIIGKRVELFFSRFGCGFERFIVLFGNRFVKRVDKVDNFFSGILVAYSFFGLFDIALVRRNARFRFGRNVRFLRVGKFSVCRDNLFVLGLAFVEIIFGYSGQRVYHGDKVVYGL